MVVLFKYTWNSFLIYVTRNLYFASRTCVRSLMLGYWYDNKTLHSRRKIEYLDVSDTWICTNIQHHYLSPCNIGPSDAVPLGSLTVLLLGVDWDGNSNRN